MLRKTLPIGFLGVPRKGEMLKTYGSQRVCQKGCGTILSRYNKSGVCSACEEKVLNTAGQGAKSYKAFPAGVVSARKGQSKKQKT